MKRWHRALVTGASTGLGEAYVRALAAHCEEVVVVARRAERLEVLKEELAGHSRIVVLSADLAAIEGQARVVEAIRQGPALGFLVNRAEFSSLGPFASSTLDVELGMVRTQEMATLSLTRAALPGMLEAGGGAVINVASIAGLLAMPSVATYSATQSFLISFSRSLRAELAETALRVQCLCPAYTQTESRDQDTIPPSDASHVPKDDAMAPEEMVRESLEALWDAGGRWLLVPGDDNRETVRRALRDLLAAC